MSGNLVIKAKQSFDITNWSIVSITVNAKGALKWERLADKVYTENSQIPVVINNVVFSVPRVSNERIKGGYHKIFGGFITQEAGELTAVLIRKDAIPQLKLIKYTK